MDETGFIWAFDDGARGRLDAAGNLVLVDNQGASLGVVPANGSAIVQQFLDTVNFGIRSAIDANYRAKTAALPATPAQTQSNFVGLALLALGAFLIYKLAS